MQQVYLEKFLQMEEAFRPHRGLFTTNLHFWRVQHYRLVTKTKTKRKITKELSSRFQCWSLELEQCAGRIPWPTVVHLSSWSQSLCWVQAGGILPLNSRCCLQMNLQFSHLQSPDVLNISWKFDLLWIWIHLDLPPCLDGKFQCVNWGHSLNF